jgi:hypothetical protein
VTDLTYRTSDTEFTMMGCTEAGIEFLTSKGGGPRALAITFEIEALDIVKHEALWQGLTVSEDGEELLKQALKYDALALKFKDKAQAKKSEGLESSYLGLAESCACEARGLRIRARL